MAERTPSQRLFTEQQSGPLREGALVSLVGLRSAPAPAGLNGQFATITSSSLNDRGRWTVETEDGKVMHSRPLLVRIAPPARSALAYFVRMAIGRAA